jgi:hypothetical protein
LWSADNIGAWPRFFFWVAVFAIIYGVLTMLANRTEGFSIPFLQDQRLRVVVSLAISLIGIFMLPVETLIVALIQYGFLMAVMISAPVFGLIVWMIYFSYTAQNMHRVVRHAVRIAGLVLAQGALKNMALMFSGILAGLNVNAGINLGKQFTAGNFGKGAELSSFLSTQNPFLAQFMNTLYVLLGLWIAFEVLALIFGGFGNGGNGGNGGAHDRIQRARRGHQGNRRRRRENRQRDIEPRRQAVNDVRHRLQREHANINEIRRRINRMRSDTRGNDFTRQVWANIYRDAQRVQEMTDHIRGSVSEMRNNMPRLQGHEIQNQLNAAQTMIDNMHNHAHIMVQEAQHGLDLTRVAGLPANPTAPVPVGVGAHIAESTNRKRQIRSTSARLLTEARRFRSLSRQIEDNLLREENRLSHNRNHPDLNDV